jgi:hypothetical protein
MGSESSDAAASRREPPVSEIRFAFCRVAEALETIRQEWRSGDAELLKLRAQGFDPASRAFEVAMREEAREPVRGWRDRLIHDPDFMPFILPYCDPALRDELLNLVSLIDPDAYGQDRYGDENERFRKTWESLNLDHLLDGLQMKLKAAGDAIASRPSAATGGMTRATIGSPADEGVQAVKGRARSRGRPHSLDPKEDEELIERWERARLSGVERKTFCRDEKITVKDLQAAQTAERRRKGSGRNRAT